MSPQAEELRDQTSDLATRTLSESQGVHCVIRVLPIGEAEVRYPAYLQVNGPYAVELLHGHAEQPTGGSIFRVVGSLLGLGEPANVPFGEMVAQIKTAFNLSVSSLAILLRVERPTIYAWLDDRWVPKEENERRVKQIFSYARYWANLNRQPLGEKHLTTKVSGHSLMELLRAPRINDGRVQAVLDYWATKLPIRVTDVPKDSMRAAAMRLGIDLSKRGEQQDVIDRITGKRISED